MKKTFFVRIKRYTWNGTIVSYCVDLKARTKEKAEKEANKIIDKLKKDKWAVYELEGIFEEVE